jgi:hypothetical protein
MKFFTDICTRGFTLVILHSWNYTCMHPRIYIVDHVELHLCARDNLQFCTCEIARVSTRGFTFLQLWNYSCVHKLIYNFAHMREHFCTPGISCFRTWIFIFVLVELHVCAPENLHFRTLGVTFVFILVFTFWSLGCTFPNMCDYTCGYTWTLISAELE